MENDRYEGLDIDDETIELLNSDLESYLIDLDDEDDGSNKDSRKTETFEEQMKKHETDISRLRAEYRSFMIWYDGMLKLIEAKRNSKVVVCLALMDNILPVLRDDDIAKLWCICMSEHSDFVFENPMEVDEVYVLGSYMCLMEDIQIMTAKLRTEQNYKQKFHDLTDNFTLKNDFQAGADNSQNTEDAESIIRVFSDNTNKSSIIRDNITYLCDIIAQSPELSQIAPVVLYAVTTKYQKKMTESTGFEPNLKKALEYKEFIIDRDNGKNIANFCQHLKTYRTFRQHSDCDKALCDIGFSELSNIVKCNLLKWKDYPMINRPVQVEAEGSKFSCFPGGYKDNPYYSDNDIDMKYLNSYEALDQSLPKKKKVLQTAAVYISKHEEIAEKYIKMIENDETDKCVSLILEIINKSGIDAAQIKPTHVNIAFSCIMQLVLEDIDRRVKREMIRYADVIMNWYENV